MNGVSGAISRVTRPQALVQRGEGGRVAVPEAAAGAADVPVGQVVDVRREQRAGPLGVEGLQRVGHLADQAVRLGERPAVQHGPAADAESALRPLGVHSARLA